MKSKKMTAADWLKEEKRGDSQRIQFANQWQLVGEFVNQRRSDFTSQHIPGAFIHQDLWADEPIHLAETSASALLGYLWGAGVKSFRLLGNPDIFEGSEEMRQFWDFATERLRREMGDREAGLAIALDETMLDLVTLGTDAIFVEERNLSKPTHGCLLFQPWTVQEFSLRENAVRRASKFFRRRTMTVGQLIEKYGAENVSQKSRDCAAKGDAEKEITVMIATFERPESEQMLGSLAAKHMPIGTVHIEVEAKKILRESGFQEPRVACTRLSRRTNETYGRGFGMNALPSIMMLNQVKEDWMMAMEKQLDPPMYQINDAVSGNGYIDTSAGSINIIRVDSAKGTTPVGKLFDFQEVRTAPEVIKMLVDNISTHFRVDRLLDLNNDVEMTRGEAFLRNSLRQSSLRSLVARLLAEKFDVLINAAFSICLRRNKFGYVPGSPEAQAREAQGYKVRYLPQALLAAIEADEDLYDIEYLTPAARDMMAEEGQGMIELMAIIEQSARTNPDAPKHVDYRYSYERLAEIKGVNSKFLHNKDDVAESIAREREAQQEAQQSQQMMEQAQAVKTAAEAQQQTQ